MRVGSVVKLISEEGEPFGQTGVVYDSDWDGYETTMLSVRWQDGSVSDHRATFLEDVTPQVYANIYLWDRAFGGREEGGWWYDTHDPFTGYLDSDNNPPAHGKFASEAQAVAALEAIEEWCAAENQMRRHPSSVLSEGHYVVLLEGFPSMPQPEHRPRYC